MLVTLQQMGVNQPGGEMRKWQRIPSPSVIHELICQQGIRLFPFMQFKYDEAIPLYEKLIAQGFVILNQTLCLVFAMRTAQQRGSTQKHYQKAVQFKNDNATCLFRLALAESAQHGFAASAHFNQSLEVIFAKKTGI